MARNKGWAPGPVNDMSTGARGWILWISLAIMCADSLVSLLPVVFELFSKNFNGKAPVTEDQEVESEDRLVPREWVILGILASTLVGTFLVWFVFGADGIKPWATVLGFGLWFLLFFVCSSNLVPFQSWALCSVFSGGYLTSTLATYITNLLPVKSEGVG